MADADVFEDELRDDLPRGLDERARSGRDRGMFSRWLAPEEMRKGNWQTSKNLVAEKIDGLLLGKRDGSFVGWRDDRHMLTIAGSRAGKSLSLIVPNLLLYEGSALVIDPKGELSSLTAERRGEGKGLARGGLKQQVYVLDPFEVSSHTERHIFNPLDELTLEDEDVVDDAATLASALIELPQSGEKHWAESAQAVLKALVLLVLGLKDDDDEGRDLISVRDLLALTHPRITTRKMVMANKESRKVSDEEALISLLVDGLSDDIKNPCARVCEAIGKQLRSMGDKERGGVLSSALTQTQWLDSVKMRRTLRGKKSDFKLADLKTKKTTIYLCLPATRLPTHARWLRLMLLMSLSVMERTKIDGKLDVYPPVLYVLDEFAVLGHIDSLEKAAGLMAGYGVKLWVILQSMGQLKQHYNQAWETFFANSGVVTAFGVNDHESLETLSKMLGQLRLTEQVRTRTSSADLHKSAPGERDEKHDVYLLGPHELRLALARKKNRILVCAAEEEPAIAERVKYFEDEFNGMWKDPNGNQARKNGKG